MPVQIPPTANVLISNEVSSAQEHEQTANTGSFHSRSCASARARSNGMFIYDDEIRERFPAKAEQIIAVLDADHATQKGKATRPPEARFRPNVEAFLAAIPNEEPTADESR